MQSGMEARESSKIYIRVGGARMRGIECINAMYCQEALWSGSSVTLRDKEPNAFRNIARLTPLVGLFNSNLHEKSLYTQQHQLHTLGRGTDKC